MTQIARMTRLRIIKMKKIDSQTLWLQIERDIGQRLICPPLMMMTMYGTGGSETYAPSLSPVATPVIGWPTAGRRLEYICPHNLRLGSNNLAAAVQRGAETAGRA